MLVEKRTRHSNLLIFDRGGAVNGNGIRTPVASVRITYSGVSLANDKLATKRHAVNPWSLSVVHLR
jgi:hypothetical protein